MTVFHSECGKYVSLYLETEDEQTVAEELANRGVDSFFFVAILQG